MGQNILLENAVINRFIANDKQERFLSLIAKANKRKKFIAELAHFKYLKISSFDRIDNDIEFKVKQRIGDIKDCYIISENGSIDTKSLDVDIALAETISYGMGTMLVFGDARFVYYEGEEKNNRWLSK